MNDRQPVSNAFVEQVNAMGRIQSSVGLITGVNIQDTVDKLMQLNAIPRDRLAARNQQIQRQQVAYTELTALVVGVQLTTDRLGQASVFTATRVTSSKTDVLTARSTGSPKPGNYSFTPVRQAQAQQLTSAQFASESQLVGEGELTIRTGGFLDDSLNLDDLNGGRGVQRGKISITDRSGATAVVDLRFAQTAQDVVNAINASSDVDVTASLDGTKFKLTDNSGGTESNLIIGEAGGQTAQDLGFVDASTANGSITGQAVHHLARQTTLNSVLDGRGLEYRTDKPLIEFSLRDGSKVEFSTKLNPTQANLGQLLDELNSAGADKFAVSISSSGDSLEFQDLTEGTAQLSISSLNGNLASQLGFNVVNDVFTSTQPGAGPYVPGEPIVGRRLIAGLGDVLLNSLSGGKGVEGLGEITITDRSGAEATIDLSSAQTINEVIDRINASSLGVRAQLNRSRTGIEVLDTTRATSSNLIIANGSDSKNTATRLGLATSVASNSHDGGSLSRQFVSLNTPLNEFTKGEDFSAGRIRITNSTGKSVVLNLRAKNVKTVGDVINEINDLQQGVRASINANGDGLLIVDEAGGASNLILEDIDGGTSASVLGIAGTAETVQVDGADVKRIQSSRNLKLTVDDEDSLGDLVKKLNELDNSPLRASLLKTTAGGAVRMLLNNSQTGASSRVAVESNIDFGLVETSKAQDALLAVGGTDTDGGVLLSSSTNTFTNTLDEFSVTLSSTSTTPVTVTVAENNDSIVNQVSAFVDQYNKVVDKVRDLTKFDATANTVGLLFGSATVLRVESSYSDLFAKRLTGTGSIRSLAQLGVQFNESGKLEFDQTKLRNIIEADRQGVEDFFRTEKSGFSAIAKELADNLAGVDSGALLNRSSTLQTQIEQHASRIDAMNVRLDKQRERLLKQFTQMETAIGKLQGNLRSLNQLQILQPLSQSQS